MRFFNLLSRSSWFPVAHGLGENGGKFSRKPERLFQAFKTGSRRHIMSSARPAVASISVSHFLSSTPKGVKRNLCQGNVSLCTVARPRTPFSLGPSPDPLESPPTHLILGKLGPSARRHFKFYSPSKFPRKFERLRKAKAYLPKRRSDDRLERVA